MPDLRDGVEVFVTYLDFSTLPLVQMEFGQADYLLLNARFQLSIEVTCQIFGLLLCRDALRRRVLSCSHGSSR
jgi:hypothetical protein